MTAEDILEKVISRVSKIHSNISFEYDFSINKYKMLYLLANNEITELIDTGITISTKSIESLQKIGMPNDIIIDELKIVLVSMLKRLYNRDS